MEADTKQLLSAAEAAARAAGVVLKMSTPRPFASAAHDIKLDADKAAHEAVAQALAATGIPVLSEEGEGRDFSVVRQWVVDPLDGSLNFLRGIPYCAVSVALIQDGEPVLGVVYDFHRDELYSGAVGEGARQNGIPLAVSGSNIKAEAILMTGFPSGADYSAEALAATVSHAQDFKKIRLLGSAALSLAYVAAGKADSYHEKGIYVWDVAAGLALVKAAGGVYTLSAPNKEGKCIVSAAATEALLL